MAALRVLMFGTDAFAARTTRALAHSWQGLGAFPGAVSHLEVVCPADKRRGRGAATTPVPVKTAATDLGVPVHTLPAQCKTLKRWQDRDLFAGIQLDSFDLAVVCSFGFFMARTLLERFTYSGINLHPSRLPTYRGPSPIDHTLLNGDTSTAVSIIELDPQRFDAGRILTSRPVAVEANDTYSTLSERLSEIGSELVVEAVHGMPGLLAGAVVQDETRVVSAPKLDGKIGRQLAWDSIPKRQLFNLWRAVGERAGIWAELRSPLARASKSVRVHGLQFVDDSDNAALHDQWPNVPPGAVVYSKHDRRLLLRCVDGWLEMTAMQLKGRTVVTGADFGAAQVHGKRLQAGTVTLHPQL